MTDYVPSDQILTDRSAREEHDHITGILSSPNYFAGVVKSATGELRHIAFDGEPPDGIIQALETQYGVEWSKRTEP